MQEQLSEILINAKGTLKYKWVAINLAWFISLVGWAIVMTLPNKFISEAKVHIDSTTMLQPLLKGMAVQQDSRRLINVMKQLMFTRPNLEKIIQLSNLDFFVETDLQRAELYERMKDGIKISGGKRDGLFGISYESNDANMAKDVVTAVLTVFSEQTQLSTMEDVSSSQRFIEQQIREYEIRLRNAEKAREAFKRNNFGLLPEEGEGKVSKLRDTYDQMEDAQLELSKAISKENVLAIQMQEVIDSGDVWSAGNALLELSPEDEKIKQLRNKKTSLLLKYTENHPTVIAIDITLKQALKQKEKKQNERKGLNLPYASAMTNPYVQQLQIALNEAKTEVASQSTQVAFLKKRIDKYKGQLDSRLTVETEMQNLNRDYATISENYQKLIQRREQASMSEKVDADTVSIKFKISDPPNKPLKPSGPKRLLFLSMVLILGLGVGFGLAYLIYYIKPTYMTTKQLRDITGLPILGSISMQAIDESNTQKSMLLFLSFTAILLLVYAGLMGFEYLRIQEINLFNLIRNFY